MRYEAVQLRRSRAPEAARLLAERRMARWQESAGSSNGIPLAIELATARLGALTVEQIAQRLEVSSTF